MPSARSTPVRIYRYAGADDAGLPLVLSRRKPNQSRLEYAERVREIWVKERGFDLHGTAVVRRRPQLHRLVMPREASIIEETTPWLN